MHVNVRHVNVRLDKRVRRNLRARKVYRIVYRAFCYGCDRFGFRIVHYSVQGDHIHLICEASNRRALSRGMQGFNLRVAKGINRLCGRAGSVFADRYHEQILTTPRQVRNGLRYVLLNSRRHAWQLHDVAAQERDWVDPCSSAPFFDGWKRECRELVPRPPPPVDGRLPVASAQSWLLTTGWKQHGALIATWEVPKGRG